MSFRTLVKPIPFRDPALAFASLAARDMAVLLDSATPGAQARFSYIAVDPFRMLRCSAYPWIVTVDGLRRDTDAFTALAQEMARFGAAGEDGPVPFMGGAVGFFSYELGGVLENTPRPKNTPVPADMVVGLYDTIAAFDHERREAWIIAHDISGTGRDSADVRAARLAQLLGQESPPATRTSADWRPETSRSDYESRVATTIEAIRNGDIYQANITQRFLAEIPPATLSYDLYLSLRAAAPAPFCAFMNAGQGLHLLSASPERFLKLGRDGTVEPGPSRAPVRAGGTRRKTRPWPKSFWPAPRTGPKT